MFDRKKVPGKTKVDEVKKFLIDGAGTVIFNKALSTLLASVSARRSPKMQCKKFLLSFM